MGRVVTNDKRFECGGPGADFFTLLASCVMTDPVSGETYLNTQCYTVDCEDAVPAIDCDNVPSDPEKFCSSSLFTVDTCGHLALKIGKCPDV